MLRLQNEVAEFDREEAEKRSIFANLQYEYELNSRP